MGKRKYFIAIILNGETFSEAEKIKQELFDRFGLKGALRSPAHITLHRPFEWAEEKETQLREKLRTFSAPLPPPLRLQGFGTFSKRVVFIAVKEENALNDLYTDLKRFAKKELGLFNEWEDERGFHPHVTVSFRDLKPRHFGAVKEFVDQKNYDRVLKVTGFSLLRLEDKWKELEFFELSGK